MHFVFQAGQGQFFLSVSLGYPEISGLIHLTRDWPPVAHIDLVKLVQL